jgi:protein-tyrosine phosphatase
MIPGVSNWFRSYGFAGVHDQLLIGAYPLDAGDVDMLAWVGIERVLNLVEDEEYDARARRQVVEALAAKGIQERRLNLEDYGRLPAAALEQAVSEVNEWLDEGLRTYVHCRAGWQRSAAVAAGVVAIREGIDIDEALDRVRDLKPSANPLPHQRQDLRTWWDRRSESGRGPVAPLPPFKAVD